MSNKIAFVIVFDKSNVGSWQIDVIDRIGVIDSCAQSILVTQSHKPNTIWYADI